MATTTRKRKAYVKVFLHKPASAPENVRSEKGTTLEQLVDELNLSQYIVRVNGKKVSKKYELQNNDVIRIGIKTKQG